MGGSTGTPFGDGTYVPDPLAQFLGRVVPWGDASFVYIHAFGGDLAMPYRGGGRAFASMDEYGQLQNFTGFLNHIRAEAFFCLSGQSVGGQVDGRGNRKVSKGDRKATNARWLRSFVLDLDVKPTGYPSQQAALASALPFFDKIGLKPGPIVSTGRGLHVYVTLSENITRAVWQPLADRLVEAATQHGLKFDTGVTRNPATLLRLPGSFNRKDPNNPKESKVLSLGETKTLAEVTAALSGFSLTPGVSSPKRAAVIDPAILPPRPPIRGPEANRALAALAASRVVTSIDLLRRACPVVASSENRGGDTDLEPLWFELAKLCHYVQNGRDYFHDLSSEDPRYDPEQTDAKYDQAEPQGWPACATIARASPAALTLCQGCRFNGQGQSPINFATRGESGTAIQHMNGHANGHAAVQLLPPTDDPILLPPGFAIANGLITHEETNLPVFTRPVHGMTFVYRSDGTVEKQAGVEFCISLGTQEHDDRSTFTVPLSALKSDQSFADQCYSHGLMYVAFKLVKIFMTAWVTLVQERRSATAISRMGWVKEDGEIKRFAYGGRGDPDFGPKGLLDKWKQGAGYFVGKGCTEMEVLMAASVAATLIPFTGVDGVVVHARAPTGRGKSAALETSATMWMSRTMVVNSETAAHTRDRIAVAHNLPVFNDEFIANPTRANIAKFGEMILNITSGREHGRMQRSQNKSRGVRFSQTMLITAANFSLVRSTSRETTAQAVRVLEIELSDAIRKLGIRQDQITHIKELCDDNHGTAGLVVADYLSRNHGSVKQAVGLYLRKFQDALKTTEGERFWLAGAAAIMVAAIIIKNLGLLNLDIVSMEKFLLDLIRYQRSQLTDISVDADDPVILLHRIANFMNQHIGNVIFSKHIAKQGTNPHNKEPISYDRDLRPPYVGRIATEDKAMLVSEARLGVHCQQNDHDYHQMRRLLVKAGYCKRPKNPRSLTAGTTVAHPTASEPVLEFDLSRPELERFLSLETGE